LKTSARVSLPPEQARGCAIDMNDFSKNTSRVRMIAVRNIITVRMVSIGIISTVRTIAVENITCRHQTNY
jgi:hypothetical protein